MTRNEWKTTLLGDQRNGDLDLFSAFALLFCALLNESLFVTASTLANVMRWVRRSIQWLCTSFIGDCIANLPPCLRIFAQCYTRNNESVVFSDYDEEWEDKKIR